MVHNLSHLTCMSCLWVYLLSIWLHIWLTLTVVTFGHTYILTYVLTSFVYAKYLLICHYKEIEGWCTLFRREWMHPDRLLFFFFWSPLLHRSIRSIWEIKNISLLQFLWFFTGIYKVVRTEGKTVSCMFIQVLNFLQETHLSSQVLKVFSGSGVLLPSFLIFWTCIEVHNTPEARQYVTWQILLPGLLCLVQLN